MATSIEAAEAPRAALIDKYLGRGQGRYDGVESAADGVNHLAFISNELEETVSTSCVFGEGSRTPSD
jgi:hypothetical protein